MDVDPWTRVLAVSGYLLIFCWLFAQVPQVIENYRNSSVDGVLLAFLGCWILGDMTNLAGCLLTDAMLFQVLLALYYCMIDVVLAFQYYYYTQVYPKRHHHRRLKHTNRLQLLLPEQVPANTNHIPAQHLAIPARARTEHDGSNPQARGLASSFGQLVSASFIGSFSRVQGAPVPGAAAPGDAAPGSPPDVGLPAMDLWHRVLYFVAGLFQALLRVRPSDVGMVFAWCCTCLYLLARMPQLVANHRRKSTHGLSVYLFVCALFGNILYTVLLLLLPDARGPDRHGFFAAELPYLMGSMGTVGFDLYLLCQFYVWDYGREHHRRPPTGVAEGPGAREYSANPLNILPILILQRRNTHSKLQNHTPITVMDLLDMLSLYGDRVVLPLPRRVPLAGRSPAKETIAGALGRPTYGSTDLLA